MKKLLIIILLSPPFIAFSQTAKRTADSIKIKNTVIHFLRWYKQFSMPTTKVDYNFIKHQQSDKYPPRIDWLGLDRYFNHFRQTGLVTEAYINTLKDYFLYEDRMLKKMRPQHDLVKIAGMDTDFVFNTFEPDEILNHIDESYIAKFYVIYRKALIELHVSKYIDVVFALSKAGEKWQIDYIGGDAFQPKSFFAQ